jgi:tRNA (guanine10-N2)-methyltransferase
MPNNFILDPFVGTGSLLIPPSHFKAITWGCDIDIRVLRGICIGYTKPEIKNGKVKRESNIFTNFKHYGLPLPQIFRSDINLPSLKSDSEFFDAIICDPPYGERAFSRKTGMENAKKEKRQARLRQKYGKLLHSDNMTKEDQLEEDEESESDEEIEFTNDQINNLNIDSSNNNNINTNLVYSKDKKFDPYYFAALKRCPLDKIFEGLLNLGKSVVKPGGYLVCLYPVKKNKGDEE